MIFRWFTSASVRQTLRVRKHFYRLLSAQRDVLSPPALAAVTTALNELDAALAEGTNDGRIRIKAEELEFAANKWLKPYPHAAWRENVEVLLVALAVALSIRTFFLQPFKIPTGSMQPTLFGVTSSPDFSRIDFSQQDRTKLQEQINDQLAQRRDLQFPTGLDRIKEWFEGNSYVRVVAANDGELQAIDPPVHFLIFNIKQTIWIGGVAHTLWFPPDFGDAPLWWRAGLRVHSDSQPGQFFHKGDEVLKMCVRAGDHLFVDRVSYNFCKPKRGEIIVFATAGTQIDKQDEFYIKRLTVMPGEHVQIGDDRHLIIDGRRLDKTTPHFEKVYGFDPAQPPAKSVYSGHVNGTMALHYGLYPNLAPLFPNAETVYTNASDALMVMGDNTCDSSDSRTWGSVPVQNVIGKSFFVYWPLTGRFGWGNR
jgi:signal peptidase I